MTANVLASALACSFNSLNRRTLARQALEEEFILNVLKHYTTYATYTVQQGDMRAVALTLEVDGDAGARRDHGAAAGTVVSRKHGMTSRPNSSSDRIAKSCGRPKLAP